MRADHGNPLAGLSSKAPPRAPMRHIFATTFAATILLVILGAVAGAAHIALLIPPMAASATLIVGAPGMPLAQPRNVVLGHFIGGLIGLAFTPWFGGSVVVGGLAAGIAMGIMLLLRCAHSPGAATAMLVITLPPDNPVAFLPALVGASLVVVATGVLVNRVRHVPYPEYWW